MKFFRLFLLLVIGSGIVAFFYFDLHRYLTLEILQAQHEKLVESFHRNPELTVLGYFLIYVSVTALSLPGATVLTLAGGAVFGLLWGTVIISFASTIGACLAFLSARFLFRDVIKRRYAEKMQVIDQGVQRDGWFYLLSLRLIPVFPFFLINLLMGLTAIRLWTFYWVSQLGMLPATLVYVNAGTQLAKIQSLVDIVSPKILLSLGLLGIFPLLAKYLNERIKRARLYRPYKKPRHFDNNLVVIGAGSGGLVTAYIAAAVKAKVTLIEKHKMGGDCLNTGCVPSKALIRSANWLSQLKRHQDFGFDSAEAEFNFSTIMQRVHAVIDKIEPHDSVERYQQLGVNVIKGTAQIKTPWEVEIKTDEGSVETITTRSIVIATGARPFIPDIPGLEQVKPLSSDNLWQLKQLPKRLLVLGGGPIGCELAQAFARLGSRVTQIEMAPRILMREDPDVSELLMQRFRQEGVDLRLEHVAKEFIIEQGEKILIAEHQGKSIKIAFDQVLVAIGRVANVKGYGAEELGLQLTDRKTLQVNPFQQTNYPNIYAVGDVAGLFQFTHTAAHQAWYAAVNALLGGFKRFKTDYSVIPWSTFTDPEIARAGLNEQDAKAKNIPYEVTRYDLSELDRAITDETAHGFIKVLTPPGKDKILGVTIVGVHGGDLLAEFVLAMKHGLGLNKILGTIHIYPTLAEANKYVAGNWKRNHVSATVLTWLEKYHSWQRH